MNEKSKNPSRMQTAVVIGEIALASVTLALKVAGFKAHFCGNSYD